MTCRPCTFSQGSEADCSPTSFSGTRQLSLWSGSHTPAKSCANEPQKDGSPACTCGKGMSDCSIHPTTPGEWIASMQGSLAKTLASLESRQAYLREPDQVFTAKSCALLASFDRATCSWKTLQRSFLTDSEPFSQTWPRWGMTVGGSAYAHPMSERRITETDGSLWQTMTVSCAEHPGQVKHKKGQQMRLTMQVNNPQYWPTPMAGERDSSPRWMKTRKDGLSLEPNFAGAVKMFPTPTNHNHKETGAPSQMKRNTVQLGDLVGGQLNPDWVAWLMGFPIAWASLKVTETRKSHCKPQSHGDCSAGSEAQ